MNRVLALSAGIALLAAAILATTPSAHSQPARPVARIAEIEVDPQQLAAYRMALQRGIEAALRSEPGVLALYAVSIKAHPEQVRLFELYASPAAYQHHLQTPHFKQYKASTQGMVRSLRLLETDPILLGSRSVNLR